MQLIFILYNLRANNNQQIHDKHKQMPSGTRSFFYKLNMLPYGYIYYFVELKHVPNLGKLNISRADRLT